MRKICYVKWIDSTSYGKIHKDDKSISIDYIESSGLIVKETKKQITLAIHFNHTPDHYTQDISIPVECIKKIRRYKID